MYCAYGKIVFIDVYGDTYEDNITIEMECDDSGKWSLKLIDIEGFEYEMLYH